MTSAEPLAALVQESTVPGEVWECGVFRGLTAKALAQAAQGRTVRLFDTFCGRPDRGPEDWPADFHGDRFEQTSVERVRAYLKPAKAVLHVGLIPQTFDGLEDAAIAFAYVDVDLYRSTYDAVAFVWPRVVPGGMLAVDDCESTTWPGVTTAVRELLPADERRLDAHCWCWTKPC